MKFQKVLIANRGAIAVRVIQAIQELGMKAVAVYSTPDERALHLHWADEAYELPGESPVDTYLNQKLIIDIARNAQVDAIHPGYGFLSENAEFALAVRSAGMEFIGPSVTAISEMGSKTRAREIMQQAGVPVVPGFQWNDASFERVRDEAEKIGYPILVKASAGGGGKGMKIVTESAGLVDALESAKREAKNAFGDDTVFIEKYLVNPRHIEVQILGDEHGNIVHLFERECSIQRRHQKILEEAPSPFVTPELRARMCRDAINAGKTVRYSNAGTVEFIVDATGNYYFLEMNTRLQVEHSVTEMTTGIDLVKMQLRIAMGEPLPWTQDELQQHGHAIEVRIYAEDPETGFLPSTGTIRYLDPPEGVNIRNDLGIHAGVPVSLFYDPLLAKLTVFGMARESAIERLDWALERYGIGGVRTNIQFLRAVLQHPAFRMGETDTGFIPRHFDQWRAPEQHIPDEALVLAALSEFLRNEDRGISTTGFSFQSDPFSPWQREEVYHG